MRPDDLAWPVPINVACRPEGSHSTLRIEWAGSARNARREHTMLHYAVVFLVIALIAALFGFTGIAAGAASIAKILFVVFLIFAAISFLVDLLKR
jgi:uncharacterized membrane protein YtjA (UPF0391 family)